MSEPYKPGDVVRTIVPPKVIKSIDPAHAIDRFLHFEDGTIGRPQNYELVEPSVPLSKIREVLCGMRATEQLQIRRRVIEAVCLKLTGEVM